MPGVVTIAVVGAGWCPLARAEAAAVARQLGDVSDARDREAALAASFAASVGANLDTIVLDPHNSGLIVDAIDAVLGSGELRPEQRLRALRDALTR
jgi:hypothetical protein